MLTQAVTPTAWACSSSTGSYTCGQSSTGTSIPATAQLYLVATGGTTTSTTSNPALTMVTAVGPCSNLSSTSFDTLNEITTAAAAWALAPFASSTTNLGATSTNTLGITNAFLDAALLANPATGAPAMLPTNLTVEAGKLAALADALNSCTTDIGCSALFTAATPPSGIAPTDTFTAALNIAHNPGENVAAIFATIPTTPPFPTTLTASPNDWTMSLTVTGGGLNMPTALGIDSQNNIWVANQDGPLSAFTAQGTPLSTAGYGAGTIAQVYGLAIDTSNDIWVTNYNGAGGTGSVTKFFGVNDPATLGTSISTTDSICYPTAAAADTNGNVFIANEECSSATILDSAGTAVTPFLGASFGLAAKPLFLAVDTAHGVWLSDNDFTIAHIAAPSIAYPSGQLLSHPTCCYELQRPRARCPGQRLGRQLPQQQLQRSRPRRHCSHQPANRRRRQRHSLRRCHRRRPEHLVHQPRQLLHPRGRWFLRHQSRHRAFTPPPASTAMAASASMPASPSPTALPLTAPETSGSRPTARTPWSCSLASPRPPSLRSNPSPPLPNLPSFWRRTLGPRALCR